MAITLLDAFVAELDSSGSNLIYSTYLGGPRSDGANSIAVDSSGQCLCDRLYLFDEFSNDYKRVAKTSGLPIRFTYNANAFVTEISSYGTNLVYSSYFGGTNFDEGKGIAVDNSNCVYVTGFTASTNFPNTNAFQQYLNGSTNAFVAKFTPS